MSDESILAIAAGAWREALAADGLERVYLVGLVGTITVLMPVLFVLMLLEMLGVL